MSGIAAIIHFDGRPVERGQIEAMTRRMGHRGPDGIHHWVQDNVALGHCMLHTTGEAMDATLPLTDESGQVVLIFDGWVANYEELRDLLRDRGARLRSRADAELVLQAYLLFGEEFAPYVEGDYALVLWDGRVRKVVGVRDRFGRKPFYYHWNGNTLSVASELAPVLELPWVPEELDEATVAELLENDVCSREATLWQGITRLVASHRLVASRQGLARAEYWRPVADANCPVGTLEDAADYYREILIEAVRRASRSHLTVGYEASGGLDSSAVFSIATSLEAKGRLPAPGMAAFTYAVTEAEYSLANDLPYAQALAAFLSREIKEVPLHWITLDEYEDMVRDRRTYPGWPGYFFPRGIYGGVKKAGGAVIIAGDGGDEWLSMNAGLDYADTVANRNLPALWQSLKEDRADFGVRKTARMAMRYGFGTNLPAAAKSALRRLGRMSHQAVTGNDATWIAPRLQTLLQERRRLAAGPQMDLSSVVHRSVMGRFGFTERVLAYENIDDEVSRAGIERRAPFDSRRIVELAYAMPALFFRQGGMNKKFHRVAMADYLPEKIVNREDKGVFPEVYLAQGRQVMERLAGTGAGVEQGWIKASALQRTTRLDLGNRSRIFDVTSDILRFWRALAANTLR